MWMKIQDLFYKEVQDGIDSLLCGKVDTAPDAPTLALVGGKLFRCTWF